MATEYIVTVKTSDKHPSLSPYFIDYFIQLHGNGKDTEWVELKTPLFHGSYFKPGGEGTWTIKTGDVGIPDYFKLKKTKPCRDWFCELVTIKQTNSVDTRQAWSRTYPVYSIINKKEFSVFSNISRLPQDAGETKSVRSTQLNNIKDIVRWNANEVASKGQLRWIDAESYFHLPLDLQKSHYRLIDFAEFGIEGVVPTSIDKLFSFAIGIDELNDYHKIHYFLDKEGATQSADFLTGWDSDQGMGQQMLTSATSFLFKECKEIPDYFNVTDEDLKGHFPEGATIESEIAAGKLFISDFSSYYADDKNLVYTTLENGEPCQVAPAICLFYINASLGFVPIAIQLKPNEKEYLFTADGSLAWLLAKMYYRNASSSIFEWIVHYVMTHATIEAFQVGIFRTLSQAHPMYKLLRPHVRTVAAMGALARAALIPNTSLFASGVSIDATSMLKANFKTYNIQDLNIPEVFKKNGVHPEKIPKYYYGQYTLKIWKIVENHVTNFVNLYYKSDQDVIEDTEIQAFAHEMAHEAFGYDDGNFRGMPEKIETRDTLIEICTIIIATSSAQHSAVNFAQYETYKFAPNSPAIMRLPCPKNTDKVDLKRIIESLPSVKQIAFVVGISFALSKYSRVEVYLDDESRPKEDRHGEVWFYEKEERELIDMYQEELKKFEKEIELINSKIIVEYTYMKPSQVPQSIAI